MSPRASVRISRELGLTNCWIERGYAQKGYGGTTRPPEFAKPDYHFTALAAFAHAVAEARRCFISTIGSKLTTEGQPGN